MRIKVDPYARDAWKWEPDLTLIFSPFDVERGESYLLGYTLHEIIEANLAKAICGGHCDNLCERLLAPKRALQPNLFKIKTWGRAGICHVLTWLIGRW